MRASTVLSLALGAARTATASSSADDALVHKAVALAGLEGAGSSELQAQNIQTMDIIDDIWDAITDATTCAGCQAVLALLKGLALLGEGAFTRVIISICQIANVQDNDVCEGAVGLQTPIIYQALRGFDLGSKTSELFCVTFLGLCAYPDVDVFELDFPSPRPESGSPGPSGQEPLKVVHFADTHIDPLYIEGANTECSKPICCRPYTPEEAPGQTENPAGPFGDPNCNTPVSLEESMLAAINELVPNPAFTLFTGDIVDNGVWNTSRPYNEDLISSSYERISGALDPVYIAIGNHEMHPTNVIAPKSVSISAQWMYDVVASSVSQWVGDDAAASIRDFGGYSVKHPNGNLRIITLNTNFYYTNNYYMYQKEMDSDPEAQLEWFVSELDAAESAGENVWVVGHQAFGDPNTFQDATTSIDRIINRYSDIIRGMFFGHTHSDHFQITYSNYDERTADNAKVVSYINPSLTPASGRNPSFRVYDVDPETFAILDATVYYADMKDTSFQSAAGPEWKKYYSAKETYGPLVSSPPDASDELTAGFWHEVTEVFESDGEAFAAYMSRKSRGYRDDEGCDDECRDKEICQLRAARSEDNCYVPSVGINFRKAKAKARRWEVEDAREQDSEEIARAVIAAVAQDKDALALLANKVASKDA